MSGAIYSGVPHIVKVWVSYTSSFAIPKSVSLMCPSLSINIFSGFRSRYIIFLECKDSIAKNISPM